MGHQAAQCTSGTVNWRSIYGDKAFVLKGPQYWSEEQARKKARILDKDELAKKAADYAKKKAEQLEDVTWEEIEARGKELQLIPPEELIKKVVPVEEEPLPAGWAMTRDPTTHKPYYWHKKTNKTVWDRPTEETPFE